MAPVAVGSRRSSTPVTSTSVAERLVVTPSSGYSRRAYGPVIVTLRLWQPAPSPRFPTGGMMAVSRRRDRGDDRLRGEVLPACACATAMSSGSPSSCGLEHPS